jgi:hypothetical protein
MMRVCGELKEPGETALTKNDVLAMIKELTED